MDGTNPQAARGWMDLFHHGKTGANAIDTHRHAKVVEPNGPSPEVDAAATRTTHQLTPLTSAEADALEEFKRLMNKPSPRADRLSEIEHVPPRESTR